MPPTLLPLVALLSLLSGDVPAPPPPSAPADSPDSTELLRTGDLSSWRSLDDDGHPRSALPARARWDGASLQLDGDEGDILTRESFGEVHFHVDVFVPPGAGASILLAGRYEIPVMPSATSVWQRVDVAFAHRMGSHPRVSVWTDDVLVRHDEEITEGSPRGFTTRVPGSTAEGEPLAVADDATSARADWGADHFAVDAVFKSNGRGTLLSKCPPEGVWVADAKALFLRGGRLVYDIGWVGAVTSDRTYNDGEWHHVVLTSDAGTARMFVDGDLVGEHEDFAAPDQPEFVLKVGDANENFGGTYEGALAQVRFFDGPLSAEEARAVSEGHPPPRDPVFDWASEIEPAALPAALEQGDPLAGPIRLQTIGAGVRFANAWTRPLGAIDHAGLIETFGPESFLRGASIYAGSCVSCHGKDGNRAPNPRARPFARDVLKNGIDPRAMFETLTHGYGEMAAAGWLSPRERYDVVHYVREAFLRERNSSQYFEISDAWKNGLPKSLPRREKGDGLVVRDYGPCLASQLGDDIGCGLTIRLDDDYSFAYDLQTMESAGAWRGFLDLAKTQHHQQRGEGRARPKGPMIPGLDAWGWGHGGTLDWDRGRRPPRGPLPKDWLEFHGHFKHERTVILSYAIDGRDVLEAPSIDRSAGVPVFVHRMRVNPGPNELVLSVVRPPDGPGERVWTSTSTTAFDSIEDGRALKQVTLARFSSHDFASAAVIGDVSWEVDADGRAQLRIPASDSTLDVTVFRTGGETSEEKLGFETFLDNLRERPLPPRPETLQRGGPSLFGETLTTRGALGEANGPYAVDTVEIPFENPWNAWVRTSAVDFFDDGRAAVATYGGDVWIVDGLDADLDEVTWRRYASGMFEPMGVKVVDGEVLVTGRDRITRLHDLNDDGEADYYESFFADPDVSPNFHAFNFDLQADPEGNLYYAKSGQYTDFELPGAILKVAPDGESYEVFCTGLRTPNGMGMSPDGRPLVSDNQGNWIPASKVSLTKRDGFYGVFKSINTSSPGKQIRETFDEPVVWMPQHLDSSSGGQLFLDDRRIGPLAGRYLHSSFGKGWLFGLSVDESVTPAQGAVWKLPFQFDAGVMRLRTHPLDGQVWATGLSGWQGPGKGKDGCLERLRFTGDDTPILLDAKIRDGRLRLTFSGPLGRASTDPALFTVKRWNYRWARSYGSDHWSVSDPNERGEDELIVDSARLDDDGRVLELSIADLKPCHQLQVEAPLVNLLGQTLPLAVAMTLHSIPGADLAAAPMQTEDPWVVYEGGEGPGAGKHVVLISGDEEYRSEEFLPQLGKILSQRHGFKCTVLFSIDDGGAIDPETVDNIPGLAALDDADLMVMMLRFRDLPDAQMKHIVDYVESGKPMLGIRTSTHAFNIKEHETYKRYSFRNSEWEGGFGRQVLGETWVAHHGGHGSQCTRGLLAEENAEHPILRGLKSGDIWDPTDVYTVRLPMFEDLRPLVLGEVVDGMKPDDPRLAPWKNDEGETIDKNDPIMPVAWVRDWEAPNGVKARVFGTTMGTSEALLSEGSRRLYVNACYWAIGLEAKISDDLDVTLVGEYEPSRFGFGRQKRDVRPAEHRQ